MIYSDQISFSTLPPIKIITQVTQPIASLGGWGTPSLTRAPHFGGQRMKHQVPRIRSGRLLSFSHTHEESRSRGCRRGLRQDQAGGNTDVPRALGQIWGGLALTCWARVPSLAILDTQLYCTIPFCAESHGV